MVRVCLTCKTPITGHFNRKRCEPCARKIRKSPLGTLTPKEIRYVKKWAGRKDRHEIAKDLKTSLSNIKRSCPNISLTYHYKYCNNPDLVKLVCAYYEKHGRVKTQTKFPEVSVRSIVERYPFFKPRQSRWTDQELLEVTKMAGLISFKNQAKYFNRPLANAGSITSVWVKNFKTSQQNINGMAHWRAINFVKPSAPFLQTPFGSGRVNAKRILLWVDMEKHLNKDAPLFLKESVKVMAEFQRKLFGVKDVRSKVLRMINKREV